MSAVAKHFTAMADRPKPESAPKTLVFERCDANDEVVMSSSARVEEGDTLDTVLVRANAISDLGLDNVTHMSIDKMKRGKFVEFVVKTDSSVTRPAGHFMDNIVFPERTFTLYPPV